MKLTDTLLAAPTAEPVTLAEVKVSARIDADITAFDLLIPMYITTAREQAEHETERCLMPQTWRAELDGWDWEVTLKASPFIELADIEYHDGTGWVLAAANLYEPLLSMDGKVVLARTNEPAPALAAKAGARVRVTYSAGYGTALPKSAKQWIIAQASHWVNYPEAANERALIVSPFLGRLLDPLRTWG
jgi:uncharacterized phiE125 gp8 family phage protein